MCGIFGYIGKRDAAKTIIEGLKRLEYRGYDSWGVAVVEKEKIEVIKKVGAIGDLSSLGKLPYSNIGIGHTRWATHGGVTNVNAHPHYSTDKSFVVAQNGIVENYQEIKNRLIKKGYVFYSQTDTEVIVRLIEYKLLKDKELFKAVRSAFLDLKGRNTIIVLPTDNSTIYAVRNGSPLVVGLGKDEVFITSDTLSFADKTDKAIYVNNYEMVVYEKGEINLFNVNNGKKIKYKVNKLDFKDLTIEKEGYDHFMIKEIIEQKHTIKEAVQYTKEELEPLVKAIKKANHVYTVGAGTAGYAAGQIAYFLRKYANINSTELKSYDVDSYSNLFNKNDLVIGISQSGETADTIEALEIAKSKGVKIASLVNMLGSTITRISDYQYYSRSGPEICVASTKAFTAQVSWGFLLTMAVNNKYSLGYKEVNNLSEKLQTYFSKKLFTQIKSLAKKMSKKEHFFVLGKGQNYYVALEGALKVKEISYKHFEGFSSGELKHGVIALIEKDTPVFVISDSEFREDMDNAAAQVKARGAYVVGIGNKSNELYNEFIKTIDSKYLESISNIIPFQLLSYYLGVTLGNSPDKPRNLAKSVTVK